MIQGKWHSQGSAAQSNAALRFKEELFTLELENGQLLSGRIEDLKVSDRLGKIERKLTLEDGSVFATYDNEAIDKLFREHTKINAFIHAFESNLAWVAIAAVVIIVSSIAFFKWGIPWTSAKIAQALPHQTNILIAAHTLEFLDDYIFEPSQLDEQQILQIRTHFQTKLIPLESKNEPLNYQLHFRKWDDGQQGIPNALALPSGDIILTDKFVQLSENQDELDSVLLHEMGHVVNRHSLKMVIESTLVTTIVMMVTGDSNGLADMGLGLGSLMVSSHYSRAHESEADLYAFEHMLVAKIDPVAFSNIMNRMTAYMDDEKNKAENEESDNNKSKNLLDYLSSHPSTAERVQQARQYSECFKQGFITCKVNETTQQ